MSDWGDRLREERDKLGLSQAKLAEIGGVSRPSQVSYEKSGGNPPGDYWTALAAANFDVQYIFTGVRSENWPLSSDAQTAQITKTELLDTLELIQQASEKGLVLVKRMR